MKHLKRFNEGVITSGDLYDMIKSYLANIIDSDFRFNLFENINSGIYTFNFYKKHGSQDDFIEWDDIKDDIIPFLDIMSRDFTIIDFLDERHSQHLDIYSDVNTIGFSYKYKMIYKTKYMDIKDVIADSFEFDPSYKIDGIVLEFRKKI